MTGLELAKLAAEAIGAATSSVVASHAAPPDITASPAVVVAPATPWIAFPRLGQRAVVRWELRLVLGRWDQTAHLEAAEAGYRAVVGALTAEPALAGIDPLDPPFAEEIGGTTYLVASATVTLS